MTIELVNVLDSKCPLRMLEMAFQSIKISKLSGEQALAPIAAHIFGSRVIHRWLKNTLIYILKRLDSLLSSWLNFSPWPLKMHFLPLLFLSPKTSRKISPNWKVGNPLSWRAWMFPHLRLWHDNPPSSVSSLGGVVLLMALEGSSVYSWTHFMDTALSLGKESLYIFSKSLFMDPSVSALTGFDCIIISSIWLALWPLNSLLSVKFDPNSYVEHGRFTKFKNYSPSFS